MTLPSTSASQSNLAQAAIVIKSLPRWQAANLLSRMRAEDCLKVLEAVSQIDQVTSDQLHESLNRLKSDSAKLREAESKGGSSAGSTQPYQGDDRRKTPGSIFDRTGKPFDYLINTLPQVRRQLLENEHPKNIALILSSLPSDLASTCLSELDPSTRVSAIRRMCDLDEIDQNELNELNYILKLRHQKLFRRSSRKSAGIKVAVELLSYTDPETQNSILALLEQTEPELAQELEYGFFSMEDLIELKDQEVKNLMAKVDTSYWAPALKRASYPLQQKILSNMSAGPRKLLSQQISELAELDPVAEKQAQRRIIKAALGLRSS